MGVLYGGLTGRKGEFHSPRHMNVQSWNVAGVDLSKIEALLSTGDPVLDGDVVMFQEVAPGKPGWMKTKELGKHVFIRFQGELSWRGLGMAVNKNKFSVLKRKACEHGLWVQVGDRASGQKMWLGSMYLSTGVPLDEYTLQRRLLLAELPATGDAVILAGDVNVALGWTRSDEGEPVSLGASAKLRSLKAALSTRRMDLIAQDNPESRTHVSRKSEHIGGQIVGCLKNIGCWELIGC